MEALHLDLPDRCSSQVRVSMLAGTARSDGRDVGHGKLVGGKSEGSLKFLAAPEFKPRSQVLLRGQAQRSAKAVVMVNVRF